LFLAQLDGATMAQRKEILKAFEERGEITSNEDIIDFITSFHIRNGEFEGNR